MRYLALAAVLLATAGCANHDNLLTGPSLSPVGEGLVAERAPLPVSYQEQERTTFQSLWSSKDPNLFTDRKAKSVGDVVTVIIQINDKAQFDNATERSRKSNSSLGLSAALGWAGFGLSGDAGDISGNLDIDSETSTEGEGTIDRSEKLRLQIAAVVVEELPNGNLVISGSQEVMVNKEVRVLKIAGIVRPTDISTDNSVSYEKIAEARIAYGGRGRVSDMQQPAWGQRIYDKAVPY
ncbi:flagellar basal body L-ring protein FlgH [Afifella pfennigii]|uniref:flagellar basal body L-ring protein FlgH n=1 Tax=Afifella pfennigii TaxID=209897 RepID=UPI000479597B|nr:flagellar basal body L-ring protein FlgH [Afifella pfennigii]